MYKRKLIIEIWNKICIELTNSITIHDYIWNNISFKVYLQTSEQVLDNIYEKIYEL